MAESEFFIKSLNRHLKKAWEADPRNQKSFLDGLVQTMFKGFPRSLNLEISDYFFPVETLGSKDSILDAGDRFADLLDLLEDESPESEGRITEADWLFLKDAVNDAADQIDEDLLMTVMSRIVDRKLI